MAKLRIFHGEKLLPEYTLSEEGETVLGRGNAATLRIDDKMASKSHCTIVPANGDYAVVDTGSTNGTYVAGEKINVKKKLEHGDSITLGRETNHLLIFLEG